MGLFGNSKKRERETELRKRVTVEIPRPTAADKDALENAKKHSASFRLEMAVRERSLWAVWELLCDGEDVNAHAGPLQAALLDKNNPNMVKMLLQAGASRQKDSSYFMRDAVRYENDAAVDLLHTFGARVDGNCLMEALQQGRPDMAERLLEMIDLDKREEAVAEMLMDGLRYDKPLAVAWVKEKFPFILDNAETADIFTAALQSDAEGLKVLGPDWLEKMDAQELARQAILRDQPKKLLYLLDAMDYKLDHSDLVQASIDQNNDYALDLLRRRGAVVTPLHIHSDMITTGHYRSSGEGEREFERRQALIDRVDDVTGQHGYLLSFMIRHNKWRTVEHLLEKSDNWPQDIVETGILKAAGDGAHEMLHALFTKSDKWDAGTYEKAMKYARNSTTRRQLDKIKQEVLGDGWQIEGDDTVRRVQNFESLPGSRQNSFTISHIFNFRSAEVTRVTSINGKDKEYVSFKDFKDHQNDSHIRTAYEKLARFTANPPQFDGAHMNTRKRPLRVIKRRNNKGGSYPRF
ncbi:MAG: ankyrin repeat domain-containing protein [Alphaproteobacteria bacterium]|nr:MAG: ankyrin repeat domain-containing protein [Alphaproteobacteria bacterium]